MFVPWDVLLAGSVTISLIDLPLFGNERSSRSAAILSLRFPPMTSRRFQTQRSDVALRTPLGHLNAEAALILRDKLRQISS
jgi:hypothetical protein